MNRFDYLEAATESIGANRRAAAVRKELLGHILLKREELIRRGMAEDEAESEALLSLGDPGAIAEAYGKPAAGPTPRRTYVAGIVLAILFIVTVESPLTGSLLWLAALALLALAAASGDTVVEKAEAVRQVVRRERLLAVGSAIAGVAVGLGTFGAPPPLWASVLVTVAILAPGLPALYRVWTRDRDGRDQEPWPMAGIGSTMFLVSALVIYALGHWQASSGAWVGGISPITVTGVALMPLGLAGLSVLAGAWRQMQVRAGHTTSATLPTEDDVDA